MIPFLKWVGGKSRILHHMDSIIRAHSGMRLVEPFVGAGSVFITYQQLFNSILINDLNNDLMSCYKVLKYQFSEFFTIYSRLANAYLFTSNKEHMYYQIREAFNCGRLSELEKAVCMIILNKTCYNGLYRVNKSGKFNVSWGKYKVPAFPTFAELQGVSKILQKVELSVGDFRELHIEDGDFVYFDPPYFPNSDNFIAYTKNGFDFTDHIQLKNYVLELDSRGIPFILSNSYFHNLKLWFPKEWIRYATISRCLSQDIDARYRETEVIISNRW